MSSGLSFNLLSKDKDNETETEQQPVSKKPKYEETKSPPYFELNQKRRATITAFKGKKYVDIREFYIDSNSDNYSELKPTKKGIMLTIEQFNKLIEIAPEITKLLNKE